MWVGSGGVQKLIRFKLRAVSCFTKHAHTYTDNNQVVSFALYRPIYSKSNEVKPIAETDDSRRSSDQSNERCDIAETATLGRTMAYVIATELEQMKKQPA